MKYDKETRTITINQNTGITFTVAFGLMVAGAIITATMWVAGTQSQLKDVVKQSTENRDAITLLQADNNEAKVKYAEIQATLRSIDTQLADIKKALDKGR